MWLICVLAFNLTGGSYLHLQEKDLLSQLGTYHLCLCHLVNRC